MKKNFIKTISAAIVTVLISGCGGGSETTDTGTGNTNPPVTPPPVVSLVVPEQVLNSLIIDADGDGDNDLVLSAYAGNGFAASQLLINDGSGKFSNKNNAFPAYPAPAESVIYHAKIDANGDNVDDIVALLLIGLYEQTRLQLYLGSTSGSYTAADTISDANLNGWGEIRVADFDKDGKQDFMLAHNSNGSQCDTQLFDSNCWGGRIYLNNGSGSFAPASITLSDPALASQTVHPTLRAVDLYPPVFSINEFQPYVATWNLLTADIDGDDLVDVVQPTFGERKVPSYINKSTPGNLNFELRYSDTNQHSGSGALLDVNRDGFADLVASEGIFSDSNNPGADGATETVAVFVHLNDGLGEFSRHRTDMFNGESPRLQHAREWLVADYNNDGFEDLFIADHGRDFAPFPGYANTLLINTANGLQNTTATALSAVKSYSHGATVGDVNGDGIADLYINNDQRLESTHSQAAKKEQRLWFNNGDGNFTASNQDL